jgi:hypothetical protein
LTRDISDVISMLLIYEYINAQVELVTMTTVLVVAIYRYKGDIATGL